MQVPVYAGTCFSDITANVNKLQLQLVLTATTESCSVDSEEDVLVAVYADDVVVLQESVRMNQSTTQLNFTASLENDDILKASQTKVRFSRSGVKLEEEAIGLVLNVNTSDSIVYMVNVLVGCVAAMVALGLGRAVWLYVIQKMVS